MTHTLSRTATAVLTAAVVSGVLAVPASAEVVSFTDKANDGSNGAGGGADRPWGDLGKVVVKHRERSIVFIARPARGGKLADGYLFWVDTVVPDRGPEFLVGTNLEVEPAAWVNPAEAVGDADDEAVCEADNAKVNRRKRSVRISFPRTCFERPAKVRVIARTYMEYEGADWARDGIRFGPWASRG